VDGDAKDEKGKNGLRDLFMSGQRLGTCSKSETK
jgi:hypothetical protein